MTTKQAPLIDGSGLRRAVTELGMAGAMLPSNGEGIKGHFGAKIYWPIYEEAEKLNAPLGVHVAALHHLGMDSIGVYYAVHALGHPFGIMAQAAAMLSYGVFDRFPKLRVGFLEGGATCRLMGKLGNMFKTFKSFNRFAPFKTLARIRTPVATSLFRRLRLLQPLKPLQRLEPGERFETSYPIKTLNVEQPEGAETF